MKKRSSTKLVLSLVVLAVVIVAGIFIFKNGGADGAASVAKIAKAPIASEQKGEKELNDTSRSAVVPCLASDLAALKNSAYPNQTVAPNSVHFKIGSYKVMNNCTSQSVRLSNLKVDFSQGSGYINPSSFRNLNVAFNGGASGGNIASVSTTNNISITGFNPSPVIAPGQSMTVDLYADIGSSTGNVQTTLLPSGFFGASTIAVTPRTTVGGQLITIKATSSVVGKIFMMGGQPGTGFANDVWSSPDGANWAQVTPHAQWSPRGAFGLVYFNNKFWVLGGVDGQFKNDVWSSPDGANWTQVTASAAWAERASPGVVVFNNKMWVTGGHAFGMHYNDVWSSPDGINWTQVTAHAPWVARDNPITLVFNNKLWVIGGFAGPLSGGVVANDVWSSSDGINWMQVTAAVPWPPSPSTALRGDSTGVVYNGKMFVMGGCCTGNTSGFYYNDVWSSSDGATWAQVTPSAQWQTRYGNALTLFNNKMFILAGNGEVPDQNTNLNDVWSASSGGGWTQLTASAPWAPRFMPKAIAP